MALEIIQNIVSAEKEAERLKLAALDMADGIKAEAAAKAKEILASARKNALNAEESQVSSAKKEAAPKAEEIFKSAKEKAGLIRAEAEKNKAKAVEAVIRRVVEGYGNR